MRILTFIFRGEYYQVDEKGRIKANGLSDFSDTWIFLGGSSHHWHNRVTVSLAQAFEYPLLLNRCYGWDRDHGTTRRWGGMWYGEVPRIQNAHITGEELSV